MTAFVFCLFKLLANVTLGCFRFLVFPSIYDLDGLPTGMVIWTVWVFSSADAIETVNFNKESWDFLGTLRRSQWRLYMSHAFNLAVLTQWTRFSSTIFSFWWLFCRGIAKSSPAIDLLYYGTAVGQSISM